MQYGSGLGVHGDGQRIGYRVVDREVFAFERPVGGPLALGDPDEPRRDAVLPALGLDQCKGERGADDRDVRTHLQQERNGPDVVLMRMGEHQRLDVLEALLDVADIGQDQIHTRFVVAGEQHSAVDDE